MSDVQDQVQKAIDELVESGAERGIQVAAYRRGELAVDAVAGVADPATGRRVESSTPFYNYSIGKGAASTLVHMLAERGPFGICWPSRGLRRSNPASPAGTAPPGSRSRSRRTGSRWISTQRPSSARSSRPLFASGVPVARTG